MAIRLIVTSTRDSRVGRDIADVITPLIAEGAGRDIDIVDLKEIDLPLLNEPQMPGLGNYQLETTQACAKLITESEAVVFLTPEYNGFFTATAKNAIDTIFAEWENKPAAVVGYGFGGASRAVPALQKLMGIVKMNVVDESVQMPLGDAMSDTGLDAAALVEPHADALKALGKQVTDLIA